MGDRSEAALRAEAKFKKNEQAKQESEKVWAELEAANRAADEKRARLRGLRLAKEAAEKADRASAKGRTNAPKPVKGASNRDASPGKKARAQAGSARNDAHDTAGRDRKPAKGAAGSPKAKSQASRPRSPRRPSG